MGIRRSLLLASEEYIQETILYKNNKIEVKNYYLFHNDKIAKGQYNRLQLISDSEVITNENNTSKEYLFSNDNIPFSCCILYNNGNSQRDNQDLPIYKPFFNETLNQGYCHLTVGNNTNNTNYYGKGYILCNAFSLQYNTDGNDLHRHYNKLVTYATNDTMETSKNKIENYVGGYIDYIKRIFTENIQPSSVYYSFVQAQLIYFQYLKGRRSLKEVGNVYKSFIINRIGGNDLTSISNSYSSYGLEFLGRGMPFAYYIYKEYEKQNNISEMTYYKNTLENYAKFLVDLYNLKGDIPLQSGATTGNSNSRCMALYGLSLGIELSDDKNYYIDEYQSLKSMIDEKICLQNIQLEGSIITSRYLHYTSFANFYYNLALKHYNPDNEKPLYNYIVDSCLPSGQIKDIVYCSSE